MPLASRILAVADSFDAMTSDRPYRKALTVKEALDELRRNKGTQFGPEVVDIFVKLAEKNSVAESTGSDSSRSQSRI